MPRLLQIQIPEPCHENWQGMTPNDKGRHCMSCQKTVVDFTNMSDRQILEHITNASRNVCGRFSNDQLNKDLVIPNNKKRFSWAYIWNVAIASFLIIGKVDGQTGKHFLGDTTIGYQKEPSMLSGEVIIVQQSYFKGRVIDAITRKPIAGVAVSFKDEHGMLTGSTGIFIAAHGRHNKNRIIEFSAIGYNTKAVKVGKNSRDLGPIYLNPLPKACIDDHVLLAGKVMPRYQVTTSGKIIRNIVDTVTAPFKKDIKVYPNPVIKGSSINLSLSFKEAGEYKMELMDEEGRVVLMQSFTMNSKEQQAQLETKQSWSAGTYWLRISGKNNKSVYQGKVLIQ